jgi:hypothetical protein
MIQPGRFYQIRLLKSRARPGAGSAIGNEIGTRSDNGNVRLARCIHRCAPIRPLPCSACSGCSTTPPTLSGPGASRLRGHGPACVARKIRVESESRSGLIPGRGTRTLFPPTSEWYIAFEAQHWRYTYTLNSPAWKDPAPNRGLHRARAFVDSGAATIATSTYHVDTRSASIVCPIGSS